MAKVKGHNTAPELYARRQIWREGFRYRLHARKLPGSPDIALPKYRLAIFVHGCFWHQHGCAKSKRPASNREYWERKLDRNVARDVQNQRQLKELGWVVAMIWECNLQEDTAEVVRWLELRRVSSAPESKAGVQSSIPLR